MWSVLEKTHDLMGNNFPEYRKEGEKIKIKNVVF
jgi:hypothetical protein